MSTSQNIVVLEDNNEDFHVIELACRQLKRSIHVERFTRAESLVEMLDKKHNAAPSLILLDLRMPGGGGFHALDFLKRNPHFSCIPVVVMSTSANPIDIGESYARNANAFHCKLIETHKMIELVKDILEYWLDQVVLFRMPRAGAYE